MALVRESSTLYAGENPSVTLLGGLSDAIVIAIVKGDRGAARTTTATLDGEPADFTEQLNFDGGRAISSVVFYWLNAKHPGVGAVTLATSWSGSIDNVQMQVLEYSGVNQSTPISTIVTNTALDLSDGGTLASTLTGQSGELTLSFLACADSTAATSNGSLVPSANLASLTGPDVFTGLSRLGVGEDAVAATASEVYEWTVSQDGVGMGTSAIDSVVTGSFAIFGSAAGTALIVNDMTQGQSLSQPVLTQAQILVTNDLNQAQELSQPTITQHQILTVNDLEQLQQLEQSTLIQHNILVVDDIYQAQELSQAGLTQHNVLVVNAMVQAQELGEVTLGVAGVLNVNDMSQQQQLTQPIIDQIFALLVNDIDQTQDMTSPVLSQHQSLVVDDMTQTQLLSLVNLGGAAVGCINGVVTLASKINGVVTFTPIIEGSVSLIPDISGTITTH